MHENGKKILHLGLVKSESGKDLYHCNSFMTTYQNDRDRDSFFRNLPHHYEITKIVREDKGTKHKEVIYQSMEAEQREKSGIEKMLVTAGIQADKIAAEGKTEDGTTEYEQQSQHLSHMV